MPDAKRPDPRRRGAASRPGKPRGTSRRTAPRAPKEGVPKDAAPGVRKDAAPGVGKDAAPRPGKEVVPVEPHGGDEVDAPTTSSVREVIATSAEQAAEQRFGSAARRAAILAAVVCVLTLTIAGPVRTYFGQRTEMKQLQASEAQLRAQIAELEQQKDKLADPVFIAAQARERLGFVMPGEIPYQVQLPPQAELPGSPAEQAQQAASGAPWYTALWHTIADEPHGAPPTAPPTPPGAPGAPPPVAPEPPAPGAPPPGG